VGAIVTTAAAPSLDSLLRAHAEAEPARTALQAGEREFSYGALDAAVGALASRLRALGVGPDARVAIVAPNAPAFVVALFAVWRTGGVAVPLSARLRAHDLSRILSDAGVTAFVSVPSHQGYSFRDLLSGLAPELPSLRGGVFVADDGEAVGELGGGGSGDREVLAGIAALLYTSGTTGAPKGALAAHAPWLASAHDIAGLLGSGPGDRTLLVAPMAHAFGLACLLAALASGARAVLVDSTTTVTPVLAAVERAAITILHGSPMLFAALLRARGTSDEAWPVRTGFVAGAVCPPAVIERMDDLGTRLLNLYGMTEIGAACACRPDDPADVRAHTVGRPLPGFEVRLASIEGAEPPAGELQVRGPMITPGYFRAPAVTAAAFAGEWFRTGDIAAIGADGSVRICGRAKDVLHVMGFNVFPAEVEDVLLDHPDVAQVAVIGVPRADVGEALQAFVVAREGAAPAPAALRRFVRERLAGYKVPYAIELVPELPLLPSGKPDRRALGRAHADSSRA
jgi:acyl-CoA synthetase (AMP-forming)/AMP-acid ligase II